MDYSRYTRRQLEALLAEVPDPPAVQQCNDAAAGPAMPPPGRRDIVRTRLAIARELLLRDAHEELLGRPLIDSPSAARDYLRIHFAALAHEVFVVVFLDAQNRVIACDEMFRGTLTQTSVYPREIVRAALSHDAAACMFAHNHPSGMPEPSRADELLTRNLKEALALVDVRVLDHLVFAGGRAVSFAERRLL
jgi:DNA repair protein RadC